MPTFCRVLLLIVALHSTSSFGQQCPGVGPQFYSGTMTSWRTWFFTMVPGTFVTGGCTTMKNFTNNDTLMLADCQVFNDEKLYARLGPAYQSNSSKYCLFTCGGGTCRIQGGDGLPVELMEFGIEDFEPTGMDQSEQD